MFSFVALKNIFNTIFLSTTEITLNILLSSLSNTTYTNRFTFSGKISRTLITSIIFTELGISFLLDPTFVVFESFIKVRIIELANVTKTNTRFF